MHWSIYLTLKAVGFCSKYSTGGGGGGCVFSTHFCEAWSNLKIKEINILRTAQLNFLRCMLEVNKGTPTAALYLELGILPINFEIEIKQLLYFKRILDKK